MNARRLAVVAATATLTLAPLGAAAREQLDVYDPAWHAGAGAITFWSGTRLFVMNADGSARRVLARTPDGSAALSPDGRLLAEVVEIGDYRAALLLSKPGGRVLKRLVFPAVVDAPGQPQWSRDSGAVAWEMDTERGEEIFDSNLANRVRALSRSRAPRDVAPAWSPDSRRLAFVVDVAPSRGRLGTMARDGRHRKTVLARIPVETVDATPAWSPDGRWIALAQRRGGHERPSRYRIYVVHPNGTGLRRLAFTPAVDGIRSLAWSPRSDEVAWSDRRGIMAADVATRRSRRLTSMRGELEYVAWAPGRRILFTFRGALYALTPGTRPQWLL